MFEDKKEILPKNLKLWTYNHWEIEKLTKQKCVKHITPVPDNAIEPFNPNSSKQISCSPVDYQKKTKFSTRTILLQRHELSTWNFFLLRRCAKK